MNKEIVERLRAIAEELREGNLNDMAAAAGIYTIIGLYESGRAMQAIRKFAAISQEELEILRSRN